MAKTVWRPCDSCKIAVAIWNFTPQSSYHLPLSVGDLVCVLEEAKGWYRGYLYLSPSKNGTFPISFVKGKEHVIMSAGEEDYAVPSADPVALEATECLYHWKKRLFELYSAGFRQKYVQVLNYMEDVFHWRWTLSHSNVTHENLLDMRTKLTAKIDQINQMCDLPLSPRDTMGRSIDPSCTSMLDLYQTHKQRQDEISRRVPQTGWDQKKTKDPVSSKAYHLYLVVRSIDHSFPEDSEAFLFLFDSDSKTRISENFLIDIKRSSTKPSNNYCIFSDLGKREMNYCSLYLVCQVVRKGKMLLDDKKHVSNHNFRRPYAVGVLDLRQVVLEATSEQADDDDDYQMTLFMSLHICTTHEADFSTLHLSLIKKSGVKVSGKQNITVSVAVKIFKGELQKLRKDLSYMINKSTVTVDKMGFPDVILPGDVRNDIYVTLEHGQFEKGSKTAPRNVEVAISVCDTRGQIIPECIILAAGSKPLSEYESFIYYHLNQPRWHETFKLSIPFEKINVAHLRVGFRHVAKNENKKKMDKTFAFSYLKLMREDGSILPDGTHELFVYKAEGKKWLDPSVYLKIESAREVGGRLPGVKEKTSTRGKLETISVNAGTHQGQQSVSFSGKETVYITTLTCSTKLTQRAELVALLSWRSKFPHSQYLPRILENIKYVDGGEIVKFLPDTLNCFFEILAENARTYGEYVLGALMSIFGILSDERFKHFVPVLDIYIENHFHAIAAHKDLLKNLNHWIYSCDTSLEKQQSLLTMLDSLKYLMKFIIQSYILENSNYDDFRKILHDFYDSLGNLLNKQENYNHGVHSVQAALLRNLPDIFNDIAKMHNTARLAQILASVINSIQNPHPSIPGKKMTFINAVLDSDIKVLQTRETRKALVPTVVSHLISHMEHKMPSNNYRSDDEGNIGCLNAIGKILNVLHHGETMNVDFTDIEYVTKLFPYLISLCNKLQDGSNPLKLDALVNLIGLLRVMSDKHYLTYFNTLKLNIEKPGHADDLKNTIQDILCTLHQLILNPSFNNHWVVLYHVQNSTILRVIKNVASTLFFSFFSGIHFIPSMWDKFFEVCVSFATQSCLQLEEYPDLLKAKLIRHFGDIRSQMCKYIVELWHQLGEKKGNFIPNMIGPFLEISLLNEDEIRLVGIPIVLDFMKCEHVTSKNFKRVEMEVFDKMDDLVSKGKGDEAYRDMFREILMPCCKEEKDIGEAGATFVDSVSRLIGLLLDYRNVQEDNVHKAQRMGCMLNLLNFYKEIEKEELYIRYIYKLADLQERDSNFTEAALTLLLHASTLEWTSDSVPAEGRYPVQSAKKRKEQLYHDAIRLLNQGKTWERGIPLCKELATVYETQMFDYQKLSDILRTQADFFQRIITELRVEDEYFVVGYFGKGSPLFLRNKTFIHRGQPYERIQTFIKRLTDEFPSAKILMSSDPPDNTVKSSNGLFLQVRKVIPVPKEQMELKGVQIPDKITEYYKTNEVCRFHYDRPFHKGKKDKDCEFATLYIERTTFVTESTFPGVISWFEVCNTTMEELNPLDIAIETVSSKIKETQKLTDELTANPSLNVNPLSMLLKGVIDAAVMGGISNYEKIFFQPVYIEEHPDHEEQVGYLRQLIVDQVDVLRKGLALHSQRVSQDLMAFHVDLEERFEGFQDIVFPERKKTTKGRSMSLSRPLPPTPEYDSNTFSQPRGVNRRLTGPKVYSVLGESPKEAKLKRSQTTKQRMSSSSFSQDFRLSMVSETQEQQASSNEFERIGTISTSASSLTSQRGSTALSYNDLPEDRGNYEMIDFDNDQKPSFSINPAPSYPPPVPPPAQPPEAKEGHHSYFEIDFDNEDDDDYTRVTPGQNPSFQSASSRHKSEFADPKMLGLRSKRQSKSPSGTDSSASPPAPRRNSFIERLRSRSSSNASSTTPPQPQSPPPSPPPPDDSHLAPISFPNKAYKSPSPSNSASVSDSEPILEDLESIRKRLRKQAEESVKSEISSNRSSQPVASSNRTIPDNSQPLIDFGVDNRTNRTNLPAARDEDYWDHLEMKKVLDFPPPQATNDNKSATPTNVSRNDISSTYSLATDWRTVDLSLPPVEISGINSTYALVTEPSTDFRPHTTTQPPQKPVPYNKSRSPSPMHTSPVKSPPTNTNTPPPLPKKQKSIHKGNSSVSAAATGTRNLSSAAPTGHYSTPNIPVNTAHNAPPTLPESIPRTSSQDKKIHNYTNSNPIPVPRKKTSSVSETVSPSKKSEPFVPPLPPKPVKPDTPTKGKEAPLLPPKPQRPPLPTKESHGSLPGAPPSVPPRPTKPPVPTRQ